MLINALEKIEKKIYASAFNLRSSYTFSSDKLDILLRIFYSVSLGLIIHRFSPRITFPSWLENRFFEWSWSVIWIDHFKHKIFIILMIFLFTLVFCVLSLLFVRSIWIKTLCAMGFFLLSAIEFSLRDAGHYLHSWLFVFIVFAFIGQDRKKDRFFFHTAQFYLMMTYCLSGLHKLTAFFQYVTKSGLKNLEPIEKSIAVRIYDFPYYNTGKAILSEVSSWPSSLSLFLWALVIYFQISCIFVFFRPSLYRLWGIFIVFFHLVTVFMLQVMFLYNMILVSFLFIETPYNIKFSFKKALLDMPGVPSLFYLTSLFYRFLRKISLLKN